MHPGVPAGTLVMILWVHPTGTILRERLFESPASSGINFLGRNSKRYACWRVVFIVGYIISIPEVNDHECDLIR